MKFFSRLLSDNTKKSKYNNVKTKVNDIIFDSAKEASRYRDLLLLQREKKISYLETQKRFILIQKSKYGPVISYYADFYYFDNTKGMWIIEDVKSEITKKLPLYKIKKRLLQETFIDVNKDTHFFIETT